jgi:hypothetical protein
MEQPNQQDSILMDGRTTYKINHMDQHSQESIPPKNGRNRSVLITRNKRDKMVKGPHPTQG